MPHIEMGMYARRDVTPGTVAMVGPIFHCGGTRYFLSVGHALGGPGNRNVSASRGMGYERVGQYLISATNQHADFALVRLDDNVTVDHAHSQPYPLAAADHPLQPGQIMNGYRFVEGVRATQPATLVMQGNLNAPIGNAAVLLQQYYLAAGAPVRVGDSGMGLWIPNAGHELLAAIQWAADFHTQEIYATPIVTFLQQLIAAMRNFQAQTERGAAVQAALHQFDNHHLNFYLP